jgi:hypothetical protein
VRPLPSQSPMGGAQYGQPPRQASR